MYNVVMNTTDTKVCYKCKQDKETTSFCKDKRSKDGFVFRCKDCDKQYRQSNKKRLADYGKEYQQNNKDHLAEYKKQYHQANKEAICERVRQWERENRDYINKRNRERRNKDPLYKLTSNMRSLVTKSINNKGYSKTSKTADIIGCSHKEFKKHIESQFTEGMTWDNQGEWHVDHRLPHSAGKTKEEVLVLNHHRNLQPMWEKDNLIKGDKYCPKELKKYLTKYL